MTKNPHITYERLRELVYYNPETGFFTWKILRKRCTPGAQAGCKCGRSGYYLLRLDDILYQSHRLAWLYMKGEWPTNQIDHINRIRSDNRFCNLREATPSENMSNGSLRKTNKSGHIGVCFDNRRKKWLTTITKDYKHHHVGYFDKKEDAIKAYIEASKRLHGEFSATQNAAPPRDREPHPP